MGMEWDLCLFLKSLNLAGGGVLTAQPVTGESSRRDAVGPLGLGHKKPLPDSWGYFPWEPNHYVVRKPRPHGKAWQTKSCLLADNTHPSPAGPELAPASMGRQGSDKTSDDSRSPASESLAEAPDIT